MVIVYYDHYTKLHIVARMESFETGLIKRLPDAWFPITVLEVDEAMLRLS